MQEVVALRDHHFWDDPAVAALTVSLETLYLSSRDTVRPVT